MTGQGFSQRLQISTRQEMLLLPKMLQSIEVLQLPVAELETFLVEAAQENEALRLGAADGDAPPVRRRDGEATERHDAWLDSLATTSVGLVEHLEEQLGMVDLDDELRPWVLLVVRSLDPTGYLSLSDEALIELAREEGIVGDERALGRAIAVVQSLEPRGVGGRNAIEALLLQLDPGDPDYGLLCRVLEEFLEEVAKNKLPAVARALGVDVERLLALLARLRELEPAPGAAHEDDTAPPVRPEVIVERTEEGFEVKIDSSGLPSVTIDPDVQSLSRSREQTAEVRGYLRGKVERARWLVEALEQRRRTLLRIATVVFERQRAFLEEGAGHLQPLRMNEVAELLGIHVSTVSRAVAGKYVQTPRGAFPMRHFFQAAAGGEGAARDDVRELVRSVIEAEDRSQPLSDDDVVTALAERGVELARRTVAKYRKELGIPSSYRRRRHA